MEHPATTVLYTLSLHDALPIWSGATSYLDGRIQAAWHELFQGGYDNVLASTLALVALGLGIGVAGVGLQDRKSTRLNSSRVEISYAVFCLKKKILSYQELCI